jgi:hypothetical protein
MANGSPIGLLLALTYVSGMVIVSPAQSNRL